MDSLPGVLIVDDDRVVRELALYRQSAATDIADPTSGPGANSAEEIFREIICHVDQAVSISNAESNRVLYLSCTNGSGATLSMSCTRTAMSGSSRFILP